MSETEMLEELAEIAASVRALVEWHASTGSQGLVTEASPDAVLAMWSHAPAPAGARRAAAPPMAVDFTQAQAPAAARPAVAPQAAREAMPARPMVAESAMVSPPVVARPQAPTAGPLTMAAAPGIAPPTIPAGGAVKPRAELLGLPLQLDAPPPPIATIVQGGESSEERRVKLATIADEVRSCTRCGLAGTRTQTVFARGNPASEICFVGEGPGVDEDAQGLPFVGKAGQLLDRMIAGMGYGRDDVYICNIVKCRPPENRKPEPNEMAACSPYLAAQLALVKPKVLVALGATALQGLTGVSEGITRARGKWKFYKGSIPLMPTFHPAYVLRQESAKREVWNDLKEVLRHLGKTPPGKG